MTYYNAWCDSRTWFGYARHRVENNLIAGPIGACTDQNNENYKSLMGKLHQIVYGDFGINEVKIDCVQSEEK